MKKITALGLFLLSTFSTQAASLRPQDAARMNELSSSMNVSIQDINTAVDQADFLQDVLDAYKRPAESKPWYEYEAIFMTDKRIQQGVDFWKANAATLARAEKIYQVPASIIVAIIGVETFYGGNMGKHPILDSLYTLAFYHPTRTDFFSKEFVNYIKLGAQQGWNLKEKQGSYAGAMGMGQFMPSSYLAYAVDFDGDGYINLFNSPADAIGSVANYFHKHGWKMGERVVESAQLTKPTADKLVQDRVELKQNWQALKQAGVRINGQLPNQLPVTLLKYAQPSYSEYWVARQNFYVITRYNRSPLYAMVVYNLSQAVAKSYYGR